MNRALIGLFHLLQAITFILPFLVAFVIGRGIWQAVFMFGLLTVLLLVSFSLLLLGHGRLGASGLCVAVVALIFILLIPSFA